MLKVLLSLALAGPWAAAKQDCYTLLTFRGPEAADSPEARWRHINSAQRDAGLVLELLKITEPQINAPAQIGFSGRARLAELSRDNLDWMLARLEAMYPLTSKPSLDTLADVRKLSYEISFHYLQPLPNGATTTSRTPLASPLEMAKAGRTEEFGDFYSTLVGNSAGVGFQLTVTKKDEGTYYLGAQVNRDQIRLKLDLAEESGYVLPYFSNAIGLMNMMERWTPGILSAVHSNLRFWLPSDIRTVEQMRQFLTPSVLHTVLPGESLYRSLAPLRHNLSRFVLTEADGRTFIAAALEHFLLYTAQEDESQYKAMVRSWSRPGGAQVIFTSRFYEFLGWQGLQLRVPVSVSPAQYTIIRQNPHPGRFGGDQWGVHRQPPWDSRRLDNQLPPP